MEKVIEKVFSLSLSLPLVTTKVAARLKRGQGLSRLLEIATVVLKKKNWCSGYWWNKTHCFTRTLKISFIYIHIWEICMIRRKRKKNRSYDKICDSLDTSYHGNNPPSYPIPAPELSCSVLLFKNLYCPIWSHLWSHVAWLISLKYGELCSYTFL